MEEINRVIYWLEIEVQPLLGNLEVVIARETERVGREEVEMGTEKVRFFSEFLMRMDGLKGVRDGKLRGEMEKKIAEARSMVEKGREWEAVVRGTGVGGQKEKLGVEGVLDRLRAAREGYWADKKRVEKVCDRATEFVMLEKRIILDTGGDSLGD